MLTVIRNRGYRIDPARLAVLAARAVADAKDDPPPLPPPAPEPPRVKRKRAKFKRVKPPRIPKPRGRPGKPVISDRGEEFPSATLAARAMGDYWPDQICRSARGDGHFKCAGRRWWYVTENSQTMVEP